MPLLQWAANLNPLSENAAPVSHLLPFIIPGNHTVAVIKGKECYEILQSSCSKIFSDVNKIVADGAIKLDESQEIPVEMCLGGDYKVWQLKNFQINYVLNKEVKLQNHPQGYEKLFFLFLIIYY